MPYSGRDFFFGAQFSCKLARLYEYSYLGPVLYTNIHIAHDTTGLEPAILDWYGHCGLKKLGGSGGMLPQENFKIRHSEIASEATFGPKCY